MPHSGTGRRCKVGGPSHQDASPLGHVNVTMGQRSSGELQAIAESHGEGPQSVEIKAEDDIDGGAWGFILEIKI